MMTDALHAARTAPSTSSRGNEGLRTLHALYVAHHAFVWRNARRLGAPESMVDDVVQDVFVVAGRKLGDFDGHGALRSWLFAITLHVVRAHLRTESRHRRRVAAFASQAEPDGPSLAAHHEHADLLYRLLQLLPEDRRAAIIMADLEQMHAAEIGRVLGWSRPLVYARLRHARTKLRTAAARLDRDTGRTR